MFLFKRSQQAAAPASVDRSEPIASEPIALNIEDQEPPWVSYIKSGRVNARLSGSSIDSLTRVWGSNISRPDTAPSFSGHWPSPMGARDSLHGHARVSYRAHPATPRASFLVRKDPFWHAARVCSARQLPNRHQPPCAASCVDRREPDVAEQALQTFSAVDRDRAAALVGKKALTSAVVSPAARRPRALSASSHLRPLRALLAPTARACGPENPQEWLQNNNRKLKSALQAERARAAEAQRAASDSAAELARRLPCRAGSAVHAQALLCAGLCRRRRQMLPRSSV